MSRLPYRGYLRSIWDYITKVKPAKRSQKDEVVGKDLAGNEYILRRTDPKFNMKDSRFVVPSEETMLLYTDKFSFDVPQEWDEWLRHRRDDPPSIEELKQNQIKKLQIQQRVQELEKKDREEREKEMSELGTDTKASALTTNIDEDLSKHSSHSGFPEYPDLEKVAGGKNYNLHKENT